MERDGNVTRPPDCDQTAIQHEAKPVAFSDHFSQLFIIINK